MGKIKDRFWSKVKKTKTCWLWLGKLNHGYGRIFNGERYDGAHRFSYELHYKIKLDRGIKMQIDHLCRNPACVNPKHLEYVPKKINWIRGNSTSAINARKTHCNKGHEFTEENTYSYKDRCRTCRICHLQNCREYQKKRRDKRRIERLKNPPPPKTWPKKTHCIHGHAFDQKNTYVHDGKQCCRACRNKTQRIFHRIKRDAIRGKPPRKWVRKNHGKGPPVFEGPVDTPE